MKTFLTILGLIIITTVACKKEKQNILTPTLNTARLTNIHTEYSFITDELFEYDKHGYVIKYTNQILNKKTNISEKNREILYERDENNRVTIEKQTRYLWGDSSTMTGTYHYAPDNKLQKVVYDKSQYTIEYIWQDSRISTILSYNQPVNYGYTDTLYSFKYNDDGNVTTLSMSPSLTPAEIIGQIVTTGYVYDNHSNYTKTIKGLYNIHPMLPTANLQYVSTNNMIEPGDVMEYNSLGLPVSQTSQGVSRSFSYKTYVTGIGVQ